jgi:hypothetical protein
MENLRGGHNRQIILVREVELVVELVVDQAVGLTPLALVQAALLQVHLHSQHLVKHLSVEAENMPGQFQLMHRPCLAVVGALALLGIPRFHKQSVIRMQKKLPVEQVRFHLQVRLFHSINSLQQFLTEQ